jgi:actin-like ATPase involved in cell morphogenesis
MERPYNCATHVARVAEEEKRYNEKVPSFLNSVVPARYSLSCGGAFFRLWERERGLLAEIPPCIVTDKETGEIRLYGAEAAALEGRVPEHLQFQRLWWADKILDRERLRLLLQILLDEEALTLAERWRRPWQMQVLLPESILPLHRRWLEKTAREAGWWFLSSVPAHQGLLQSSSSPKTASRAHWRVQSFLDIGFSQTRFVAYVGDEVLLAVSSEQFSIAQFCQSMVSFLNEKHTVEIPASSFYDQNWTRTRLAFDLRKQKPQEWSVESKEFAQQQQQFWQQLSAWVEQQTSVLSTTHRTEIEQREVLLVGGGAALWNGMDAQKVPYLFRRASDAPYAQLRASVNK